MRYKKGARGERKLIAWLEGQGYRCMRAAGSHGAFDVVAVRALDVLFVQCKCGRWPGSEEMARMREWPIPDNCKRLAVRWRDNIPEPDVREL